MDTPDVEPKPAPRIRQTLAGLIDAGVMAVPAVIQWRRAWRHRDTERPAARPPGWMGMLGPVVAVLGEQVGTPGGWIMSVRTVDRRTGGRIALWRTLTVALVGVATRLLSRRLTPRPTLPSQAEHRQQLLWPPLVAGLGSALVNRAVRRRLAPTLVVSRAPAERPELPHSP
jgi:hypothetical protein